MDSEFRHELEKLSHRIRLKNVMGAVAIDMALEDVDRFEIAKNALFAIHAFPCLDGNKFGYCFQSECPRCIARKALAELRFGV